MLRTLIEVNIPDERMGPHHHKLSVLHEERRGVGGLDSKGCAVMDLSCFVVEECVGLSVKDSYLGWEIRSSSNSTSSHLQAMNKN